MMKRTACSLVFAFFGICLVQGLRTATCLLSPIPGTEPEPYAVKSSEITFTEIVDFSTFVQVTATLQFSKCNSTLKFFELGLHIHTWGNITTPNSVGPHFDPARTTKHGCSDSNYSHHAGDLDFVSGTCEEGKGTASINLGFDAFNLTGVESVVGRAVVLHSFTEDYCLDTASLGAKIGYCIIGIAQPAPSDTNKAEYTPGTTPVQGSCKMTKGQFNITESTVQGFYTGDTTPSRMAVGMYSNSAQPSTNPKLSMPYQEGKPIVFPISLLKNSPNIIGRSLLLLDDKGVVLDSCVVGLDQFIAPAPVTTGTTAVITTGTTDVVTTGAATTDVSSTGTTGAALVTTAAATTAASTTVPTFHDNSLQAGLIVGIVLAAVVLLAIIFYIVRNRQQQSGQTNYRRIWSLN